MFINVKFTLCLVLALLTITGCQEDLFPSNDQLINTSVVQVGATVDDMSFSTSAGDTESFSDRLQSADALVLYFTMWCPVCDSHMSLIRSSFKSQYPNADFVFVDYISGSIASSLSEQKNNGYRDFDIIADYDNALEHYLGGTMASTIVIDKNFTVLMNEEFKTGTQLTQVLDAL